MMIMTVDMLFVSGEGHIVDDLHLYFTFFHGLPHDASKMIFC